MFQCILLLFSISAVLSATIINIEKNNNYCYAEDQDPYKFYGTKTAYEIVHGDQTNGSISSNSNFVLGRSCDLTSISMSRQLHSTDCHPVQFWGIHRHGTRLPKKSAIKDLETLIQVKQDILDNFINRVSFFNLNPAAGRLCDQDIDLLINWKWNTSINANVSSDLTSQGWQDLKLIAFRNKARFSDILSLPYSEKDFLFRHTRTQRTQASCEAFAEELFGEEARNIHPLSFKVDTLLETYKHCKFWQETVDENPDSLIEYKKFLASDVYQNMISEVSFRLGFNEKLNKSTIKNIFDMCRYEQSWYIDNKSAWCTAFTKEHLQIMEYAEDLLYYYLIGHGSSLNAKVGCMPLLDFMTRFENVIKGNKSEPKGVFYFTHSSSIQLLMTAMNMNKDKIPLKGDNMFEEKDRLWRTSFIAPFAANIDVILYRCNKGEEYRVTFYLNEKKYVFPECSNGICTWKQVQQRFADAASNCNLDFCRNEDSIHRVKH